jgi:hypothetical protein
MQNKAQAPVGIEHKAIQNVAIQILDLGTLLCAARKPIVFLAITFTHLIQQIGGMQGGSLSPPGTETSWKV